MQLPDAFKQPQEPMQPKEFGVRIGADLYIVTDHARQRFRERVDPAATDEQIVEECLDNDRAVWKEGDNGAFVLVTYLGSERD